MNVKGVVGKYVGTNFCIMDACPGVIGIFSEIFTSDLGSKHRFSFGHGCLLSVCSIDCDCIGSHYAERDAQKLGHKASFGIGSPPGRLRGG
jgi:hypothetical protein